METPRIVRIFKKIGWLSIIYFLLMFIFLMYFTVDWTPNEFLENRTIENKTEEVAVVHYARQDLVPVRAFGENNPDMLGTEQALFIALSTFLYAYLLKRKETGALKTIEEHKRFVRKTLKKNKQVKTFYIFEQTHMKHLEVDDGPRQPFERQIFVEINFKDTLEENAGWKYYCFTLDPYENYIKSEIKLKDVPDVKMKCHNCGDHPDIKTVTPKGLDEFRAKWKEKK